MMFLKKQKKHKDQQYLIAYVLRGSTASLIDYINTHPAGADVARREIVNLKYTLSKCTPVIRNFTLKMMKSPENFAIDRDDVMMNGDLIELKVRDRMTHHQLEIFENDNLHKVSTPCGATITSTVSDYNLFINAFYATQYIKRNIKKFEQEQEYQKTKAKVIEAYQ